MVNRLRYNFYFAQSCMSKNKVPYSIINIGKDCCMFNVFDEEFDSYEFLINVTDWLSVTNDSISYDEMLIMLDENGIKFSIKHSYEHQYVVIDKNYYTNLFALLVGNPCIRITRIDLKFDIFDDFEKICNKYIDVWNPRSVVGKKNSFETIYFNSRQSDIFCRFYNKTLESKLRFPCSRLEFEIKGVIARQFSMRYSFISADDAVAYIMEYIQHFMYRKNLDCLVRLGNYGTYVPFDIVEHNTKVEKFRRFIRQYGTSLLNYLECFDLTAKEFFDYIEGTLDIEELLRSI